MPSPTLFEIRMQEWIPEIVIPHELVVTPWGYLFVLIPDLRVYLDTGDK